MPVPSQDHIDGLGHQFILKIRPCPRHFHRRTAGSIHRTSVLPCSDFGERDQLFDFASEMNAPLHPIGFGAPSGSKTWSPLPISFSAPPISRIVRNRSGWRRGTRCGFRTFALMRPVMTSTEGRWVQPIIVMHAAQARAFCRQTAWNPTLEAAIMRSAISSMMMTTYGMAHRDIFH